MSCCFCVMHVSAVWVKRKRREVASGPVSKEAKMSGREKDKFERGLQIREG